MKLTDRQFTGLLSKVTRVAEEHRKLQRELTVAFNERYGCTHSDVDCDELIDALDYGMNAARYSARDVDRIMSESGAPPLTENEQ